MKAKVQAVQVIGLCALILGISNFFSRNASINRIPAGNVGNETVRIQNDPEDFYTSRIQPIFQNKCVACHGCNSSPCELKLDSYAAVERGANQKNQPFGSAFSAMPPSRMKDAKTVDEWRKRKFFSVLKEDGPSKGNALEQSLLYQFVKFGVETEGKHTEASVKEIQGILKEAYTLGGRACPKDSAQFAKFRSKFGNTGGMPLLLPSLDKDLELPLIEIWISMGAPGPTEKTIQNQNRLSENEQSIVSQWEAFLNKSVGMSKEEGLKRDLVSRYIYEHVFLSHASFEGIPGRFFELVRSRTPAPRTVDEIVTETPMESPGSDSFYYRFKLVNEIIVQKSHMVWKLYPKKLARYQQLFFETPWASSPTAVPYKTDNPFQNFEQIPAKSRAKFLLDETKLIFNAMIRGPVCTGESATYAIRDQFWIFFANPETDVTVLDPRLGEPENGKLDFMFSQEWMFDLKNFNEETRFSDVWNYITKGDDSAVGMGKYRQRFEDVTRKLKSRGYSLNDIWRADDPNALSKKGAALTIFRHGTSATVLEGAVGRTPPTSWFMTYAGIERLYYTLAAQFKYWGNVSHRALTWSFMSELRQEYENEFLNFLPISMRVKMHEVWNKRGNGIAQYVNDLPFNRLRSLERSTEVQEVSKEHPIQDFVKLIYDHLGPEIMGPFDQMNSLVNAPDADPSEWGRVEEKFAKLVNASVPGREGSFTTFFPDSTYIRVVGSTSSQVYSLLAYKGYAANNYIAGQGPNRMPSEDHFAVLRGVVGDFPNLILEMRAEEVPSVVDAITQIKSQQGYEGFVRRFGLLRKNPKFWEHFHELERLNFREQGVEAGHLDLNYYMGITH